MSCSDYDVRISDLKLELATTIDLVTTIEEVLKYT